MEKASIISVLEQCFDPEIPIDLWNLGLIYNIDSKKVKNEKQSDIQITMSLTTPGCHMGQHMAQDIKTKLEALENVRNVDVTITFDPPWNPDMMSNVAREELGLGPRDTADEDERFEWE